MLLSLITPKKVIQEKLWQLLQPCLLFLSNKQALSQPWYNVANAPSSYALAVRGLQNCTFSQNSLENPDFKYELVGAVSARTLNSSVDAQVENFFL